MWKDEEKNPSAGEKLSQVYSTTGDREVKCVVTGRKQTKGKETQRG
jgi:hypothetical protein